MKANKFHGDLLGDDAAEIDIQNGLFNRVVDEKLGQLYHFNPGSGYRSKRGNKEGIFRVPMTMTLAVKRGDVLVRDAVPLDSGVPTGWPDGSGPISYTIRPEDVGKTVAIFAGIELKTATGVIRKEQGPTIAMIVRRGGIGGVVRNVQQGIDLIRNWRPA